jgi:hypothetical protein
MCNTVVCEFGGDYCGGVNYIHAYTVEECEPSTAITSSSTLSTQEEKSHQAGEEGFNEYGSEEEGDLARVSLRGVGNSLAEVVAALTEEEGEVSSDFY